VKGNDFSVNQNPRRKPPVKKQKINAKRNTVKKPRSSYNLFFQVERELIMSDLSCSQESRFLAGQQSNPDWSKESPVALENAIPNAPLPARYRGANILNPIFAIKSERRKHRKLHGKIGFIQLSKQIAENWKTSDKEVKDYFRELSVKDFERYKNDLKRSKFSSVLAEKSTGTIRLPTTKRKNKLRRGVADNDACLEKRRFTIQDVQLKQPMKVVSQQCCISASSETDPCCSDISHGAPNHSIFPGNEVLMSLSCSEYKPIRFSSYQMNHDFKNECMRAQEDEVDKGIMQFLSALVNE